MLEGVEIHGSYCGPLVQVADDRPGKIVQIGGREGRRGGSSSLQEKKNQGSGHQGRFLSSFLDTNDLKVYSRAQALADYTK